MVHVEQPPKHTSGSKPYRLGWKEIGEFRNNQLETIRNLSKRLGPVAWLNIMGIKICYISDPEVIRGLVLSNSKKLHRDRYSSHIFKRMLGNGVLTAEDQAWEDQRKLIRPVFHATHIHDFVDTFTALTKEMCNQWQVGSIVQIEKEMMALTLRIICRTMFSEDIDGLIEKMDRYLTVITTEAQTHLTMGMPIPNWVPLPTYRRQNRALKGINELLLEIIQKRKAKIQASEEVPQDLLTMLLTARYEDGGSMSEAQILDECMTIFFAGHETTAVTLTWTWAMLLKHPKVLERLCQQVDEAVGNRHVTYDDLEMMPYVKQVLNETLRMYTPGPGFGRMPTEAFEVNGHRFEPGDTLLVSISTLHYQEEFYPNPYDFDPGRFAPEKEPYDRYTFMPFGAGSRICIGNAFAMLEMQVALATMIQSANLSLVPGQEFVPVPLLTIRPKDGLRAKVEKKV